LGAPYCQQKQVERREQDTKMKLLAFTKPKEAKANQENQRQEKGSVTNRGKGATTTLSPATQTMELLRQSVPDQILELLVPYLLSKLFERVKQLRQRRSEIEERLSELHRRQQEISQVVAASAGTGQAQGQVKSEIAQEAEEVSEAAQPASSVIEVAA
jgi:hypothetical protein